MKKTLASILAATVLSGCVSQYGGNVKLHEYRQPTYEVISTANDLNDVINHSENITDKMRYNFAIEDINVSIENKDELSVRRKVMSYANQFNDEENYVLENRMKNFVYHKTEKVSAKYQETKKFDFNQTVGSIGSSFIVPPLAIVHAWDILTGKGHKVFGKKRTKKIEAEHCQTVEINPYNNTSKIIRKYDCK